MPARSALIPLLLLPFLGAPALCAAQAWPATTASGAQARPPQASVMNVLTVQASYTTVRPPLKRPAKPVRAAEAPKLEVKAKDAWFDDQGMRFNGKGLTYKQRF
jgi:hypothetical protein